MASFDAYGHKLIRFDDLTFRWIDIKHFPWDGRGEEPDLLAELIASPSYRDTYLLPDSHLRDADSVHGPYRVAEITPGDFESVTATLAEATAGDFVGLYNPPPTPELIREIESVVLARLRRAESYRLQRLTHAEHEWASCLWEFRELVAFSRDDGEIALIVMAID